MIALFKSPFNWYAIPHTYFIIKDTHKGNSSSTVEHSIVVGDTSVRFCGFAHKNYFLTLQSKIKKKKFFPFYSNQFFFSATQKRRMILIPLRGKVVCPV